MSDTPAAPPGLSTRDVLVIIGDQTVTIAKLKGRIHELERQLAAAQALARAAPSAPHPVD